MNVAPSSNARPATTPVNLNTFVEWSVTLAEPLSCAALEGRPRAADRATLGAGWAADSTSALSTVAIKR
jgi:hypothetical protein